VKRLPAVIALVAVLLAAACSSSGAPHPRTSQLVDQPRSGAYLGAGLVPAQPRPSFTLTDTAGKPFPFATRTSGRPTFLYFGYTRCPDICPTTMADIQAALTDVPAAVAAKTYVVFVTTDVKHDSTAAIKQWVSSFAKGTKATWVGLRGTQAQIDAAQAAAHIPIAEDDGETHSAQTLLYGPDDYAHVSFLQSNDEQRQMAHDLPIVAGAKS
jgi:protein SCO1/2